ncbi:MAG: hypothetical protein ACJ76H_09010 [Bacteriovoracaceae bacterium]
MKKMMAAAAFVLLSLNAFATDVTFSTAEFTIVKKERFCAGRANGPMCESQGGTVTVAATIGCLDQLIFANFEVINDVIHAVSVVRTDRDQGPVMCYRANTITKTVKVPDIDHVTITNEQIH